MGGKKSIVPILREWGIPYETHKGGTEIAISCPFHQHSGRKKKLYIHYDGSRAYCFQCGWKGNWNKIAKKLSLPEIEINYEEEWVTIPSSKPKRKEIYFPSLPPWTEPLSRKGEPPIPPQTLQAFDARLVLKDDQLWCGLPFWTRQGEILEEGKGGVLLRTSPSQVPKTMNVPLGISLTNYLFGPWRQDLSSFPFVMVVEGPADALRLWERGIFGIALLGAWASPSQVAILASLNRRIIVALDADKTGQRGAARLLKMLDEIGVPWGWWKWESAKDAAASSLQETDYIKEKWG